MNERDIRPVPDDQAATERRVIAESHGVLPAEHAGRSFFNEVAQLRNAAKCPTCRKSTLILNLGALAGHRRALATESVAPEHHCTCKGGPAEGLIEREIRANIHGYIELTMGRGVGYEVYRGEDSTVYVAVSDPHRAASEPNDVTTYRYEEVEQHINGADVPVTTLVEVDWEDGAKLGGTES